MNGVLCFIFSVAHEGTATGMRPNPPGRRQHWTRSRPSDFGGWLVRISSQLLQISLSFLQGSLAGSPLLSSSHSLCFHHLLLTRMSSICKKTLLGQRGAFSICVVVFPASTATDSLTVGSCMVEGNSQLLMCKQALRMLALFLLHCCPVTKWFGGTKGQNLSIL